MCILLNKNCFSISVSLSYIDDTPDIVFKLRGITYGNSSHFISRLITKDRKVWHHDGMTTGSVCVLEGNLNQIPNDEWLMTTSKGFGCRKATQD